MSSATIELDQDDEDVETHSPSFHTATSSSSSSENEDTLSTASDDILTGDVRESQFLEDRYSPSLRDEDPKPSTRSTALVDLVSDEDSSDDDVEIVPAPQIIKKDVESKDTKRLKRVVEAEEEDELDTEATSKKKRIRGSSESDDSFEKLKDNLKCLICLDLFHKPIALVPCSHVFCGGCFSSWNKLTCPSCRQKVQMVVDAPKNISNMVDDFLAKFPDHARSAESIKALDKRDTIKRGVLLSGRAALSSGSVPSVGATRINNNDAINQFIAVTGASRSEASRIITEALSRNLTLDHAVNYYLQTRGIS